MLQIYWLPSHKVSQGELWALGTLRFRLSQFQQEPALDSVLPGLVYGSLRLLYPQLQLTEREAPSQATQTKAVEFNQPSYGWSNLLSQPHSLTKHGKKDRKNGQPVSITGSSPEKTRHIGRK